MIGLFAIYVVSIAYAIYKGVVQASEDSADDSNEGDSDDDDDELDTPATSSNLPEPAETFALLENGGDIETAN